MAGKPLNSETAKKTSDLISKPAAKLKNDSFREILRLQEEGGDHYYPKKPDGVGPTPKGNDLSRILGKLKDLTNKAEKISDPSFQVKNIQPLLEAIITAQKEVVTEMRHKIIDHLAEIYETVPYMASSAISSSLRGFAGHYKTVNDNLLILQNVPSTAEYQKQIDELNNLLESQKLGGKREDEQDFSSTELFRNASASIAAGLKNCYQIADNFNQNPLWKSDNLQLSRQSTQAREASIRRAEHDIADSKKKIIVLNARAESLDIDMAKGTIELGKQLKYQEKQLKLERKPPSFFARFLTATTFGLYEGGEIINTKTRAKTIENLKAQISKVKKEITKDNANLKSEIADIKESLTAKITFLENLNRDKETALKSPKITQANRLQNQAEEHLHILNSLHVLGGKNPEKSSAPEPRERIIFHANKIDGGVRDREYALKEMFKKAGHNAENSMIAIGNFIRKSDYEVTMESIKAELNIIGLITEHHNFKDIADQVKLLANDWRKLKSDMTTKPETKTFLVPGDNNKKAPTSEKENYPKNLGRFTAQSLANQGGIGGGQNAL